MSNARIASFHGKSSGEVYKLTKANKDKKDQHEKEFEEKDLINGHKLKATRNFYRHCMNSSCKNIIWGIRKGFRCEVCTRAVHKDCLDLFKIPWCEKKEVKEEERALQNNVIEKNEEILKCNTFLSCTYLEEEETKNIITKFKKHWDQSKYKNTKKVSKMIKTSSKGDQTDKSGVLGRGGFGKVMLAELKSNPDEIYSVKILKKSEIRDKEDVDYIMMEKDVLILATEHSFLMQLYYSFTTDTHIYFVIEYMSGGDLQHYFDLVSPYPLGEQWARFYAAEVTLALQFLHKHHIIHRDLKLDNILLDAHGHCRLADF
ncbi:PREDICTED: protein kinase C epsilon type-like, partial [Acromyrmex echinatior]|uniref:protein kinase C epsilon type-like n=1 Tax=Acromyrmex echinatior TaxID=103372 RepID=UPI000580BD6B